MQKSEVRNIYVFFFFTILKDPSSVLSIDALLSELSVTFSTVSCQLYSVQTDVL